VQPVARRYGGAIQSFICGSGLPLFAGAQVRWNLPRGKHPPDARQDTGQESTYCLKSLDEEYASVIHLVLLRIFESYFRHRWLYLLPIVLMTAVAAVYPNTVQLDYVAHGNMYIQKETLLSSLSALPSEGFSWVTPAQATTGEMSELLKTDAFIRAIVQQTDLALDFSDDAPMGDKFVSRIRASIWAYPLGNNLVTISASNKNPRIAHQLASAMITTYIQWKINLGLEGSSAAQTFFVSLVDDYKAELEPARQELTDYLTNHPEPLRGERPAAEVAEIFRLQALVNQGLERVRQAESKEENARLAMVQTESDVRQTYFMVDEPVLPTEPERSLRSIVMVMAACVAAGMMLALFAVVGGALLDSTYRFPIDVRHDLHLPVVAMVPEARKIRSGRKAAVAEPGVTVSVIKPNREEPPLGLPTPGPQRVFGTKSAPQT
jgi:capsular polysaccharide biosynthesis protein